MNKGKNLLKNDVLTNGWKRRLKNDSLETVTISDISCLFGQRNFVYPEKEREWDVCGTKLQSVLHL